MQQTSQQCNPPYVHTPQSEADSEFRDFSIKTPSQEASTPPEHKVVILSREDEGVKSGMKLLQGLSLSLASLSVHPPQG